MTRIEVGAAALRSLVSPVIPLAGSDSTAPILNTVLIRTRGEWLTATATDRYRLGCKRIPLAREDAKPFTALVSLSDLRHILTVFKPSRRNDIDLALTTGTNDAGKPTLTVELTGGLAPFAAASFTYNLCDGDYPSVDKLLAKALTAESSAEPTAINPRFLADFAHAATPGEPLRVVVTGQNKPVTITAGDHFLAMLMPARSDSSPSALAAPTGWDDVLTSASAPVAVAS